MLPKFICHPDFSNLKFINIYKKEYELSVPQFHPEKYKNKHILFRKTFELKDINSAIIKITADDYYKLYINGCFVTMGPAPSYPYQYNYNEINVTRYLTEGKNTIAVHTYYQGLVNNVWVSGDLKEMLWCELSINGSVVLVSDESWKCAYHTAYSSVGIIGYRTAFAECYDSRSKEVGFEKTDFDDSTWCNAATHPNSNYNLVNQITKQICVYKVPVKVAKQTDYGYFIDLEQEMVGYLSVTAHGTTGDVIDLLYSEELNEDKSVRYNMRCNCRYKEQWILSGNKDTLNNFDYKAFRYVEIHMPSNVKVSEISMIVRHYPFQNRITYNTSNKKLRSIIKLCTNTMKYGTQENFIDCPTREKGQYLGDVSIAGKAHSILTGDATLMKKAIVDFCNSSLICPGIMAVSTSSNMQEIADYSLQLTANALWVYEFDKDIDFLKKVEPYLTGIYEYFIKFTNTSGLLHNLTEKWNIVDWPEIFRDEYAFLLSRPPVNGLHNVINAYWYGFLMDMDKLYTILGKSNLTLQGKVKESFFNSFYSEEIGLFCDSESTTHTSVHSNILPLLFGMCDDNDKLKKNIINFIEAKKITSMGPYMSYFALAALIKHGMHDLAKKLICDNGAWLNMIKEGATTTFEVWGKEQKCNTSLFHPWSVAPLIVLNTKYNIY